MFYSHIYWLIEPEGSPCLQLGSTLWLLTQSMFFGWLGFGFIQWGSDLKLFELLHHDATQCARVAKNLQEISLVGLIGPI